MQPHVSFFHVNDGTFQICLSGEWKKEYTLPSADNIKEQLQAGSPFKKVTFDTKDLTGWDSSLLTYLIKVIEYCSAINVMVEDQGLPPGASRLLSLASAITEHRDARREAVKISFFARVGSVALSYWRTNLETMTFIGDVSIAFMKLLSGKARFRRRDLFLIMQECGVQALPIVSLISALVGLILAFIGAIQLKIFGVQIYVASLVRYRHGPCARGSHDRHHHGWPYGGIFRCTDWNYAGK